MFPRELWVEMMGWTASKLIIEVVLIVFYCDTDAVVLGLGSGLDEIIIINKRGTNINICDRLLLQSSVNFWDFVVVGVQSDWWLSSL